MAIELPGVMYLTPSLTDPNRMSARLAGGVSEVVISSLTIERDVLQPAIMVMNGLPSVIPAGESAAFSWVLPRLPQLSHGLSPMLAHAYLGYRLIRLLQPGMPGLHRLSWTDQPYVFWFDLGPIPALHLWFSRPGAQRAGLLHAVRQEVAGFQGWNVHGVGSLKVTFRAPGDGDKVAQFSWLIDWLRTAAPHS